MGLDLVGTVERTPTSLTIRPNCGNVTVYESAN